MDAYGSEVRSLRPQVLVDVPGGKEQLLVPFPAELTVADLLAEVPAGAPRGSRAGRCGQDDLERFFMGSCSGCFAAVGALSRVFPSARASALRLETSTQ